MTITMMFNGPFFILGLLHFAAGLLFIAGLVVLGVWLFRAVLTPRSYAGPLAAATLPAETPQEILARRFASGEITADDYQKAIDVLTRPAAPPPGATV